DAGVEEPQVVVDLGDGADGRARVLRGRLLLDRDGRRQPLDGVDVRLGHLLEELPRVGRERLDVAPLPLAVDGAAGQPRPARARAREPADHHELVARDLDVDVLQVVLARTLDDDFVHAGTSGATLSYHARGQTQSGCEALGARAAGAGDVVGDAVIRGRADD